MKDALSITTDSLGKQKNLEIAETFQREKKRLLSFIKRRIPKSDEAEDILQDVFEQLTESFDILRPIEQMTAWLFRVTRNKIIDRYRKKKTQSLEAMTDSFAGQDDTPQLLDWIFDPSGNPEEELTRNVIWEALLEALDELPPDQRNVFVWHELEDRSFKEIAGMTGISVNTLLSRKRYAVLYLRTRLQELYNEM